MNQESEKSLNKREYSADIIGTKINCEQTKILYKLFTGFKEYYKLFL